MEFTDILDTRAIQFKVPIHWNRLLFLYEY